MEQIRVKIDMSDVSSNKKGLAALPKCSKFLLFSRLKFSYSGASGELVSYVVKMQF